LDGGGSKIRIVALAAPGKARLSSNKTRTNFKPAPRQTLARTESRQSARWIRASL
jgi:hypothetical protein